MTPYKQLYLHCPPYSVGDCWRAAVGCMLDLPPDQMPFDINWPKQCRLMHEFLAARNLRMVEIVFSCSRQDLMDTMRNTNTGAYYMLSGLSANGANHIVICRNDEIMHDPAIDDSGIVGPMDNGYYYVSFLSYEGQVNEVGVL